MDEWITDEALLSPSRLLRAFRLWHLLICQDAHPSFCLYMRYYRRPYAAHRQKARGYDC